MFYYLTIVEIYIMPIFYLKIHLYFIKTYAVILKINDKIIKKTKKQY